MIFQYPRLICATSRRPQNMSFAFGETRESLANRGKFLTSLGIDFRDLVCAKQVHGCRIKVVQGIHRGCGALNQESAISDTDALVTNERNLPLAIFTADCLSIFLYDPLGHVVALVHAGRRGSQQEISVKTALLMQEKFNTDLKELRVGFGPGIRDCCYEVSSEIGGAFSFAALRRQGHFYLDLAAMNKKQLLDLGVRQENISDSNICTACKADEFFSYRREGASCGRMMSVTMLR
jgi:YfiH family protein